jgi:hypothetical protein
MPIARGPHTEIGESSSGMAPWVGAHLAGYGCPMTIPPTPPVDPPTDPDEEPEQPDLAGDPFDPVEDAVGNDTA